MKVMAAEGKGFIPVSTVVLHEALTRYRFQSHRRHREMPRAVLRHHRRAPHHPSRRGADYPKSQSLLGR